MRKTRTGLIAGGTVAFLILGACSGSGGSTMAEPTANGGAAQAVNEGATATSTVTSTPTPQDASRPAAGASQASRAFIDPVTGQFRAPTAAELAALQQSQSTGPAVKQRPPPPVQTRLPDGTIMYDMRNQPQVEEKVCVLADGSIGACPAKKPVAP